MTNSAVTPYPGRVIHQRLYKSIVEHLFTLARDVRNRFESLRRPSLIANFLSGLFYVFVPGEAAVKIDSKQFGAAAILYNLTLESDF